MQPSSTPRSQATKNRILEAARILFSAHGYEATTIRQIAVQANANVALVIRYFGSKEALFGESVVFDLQLPAMNMLERAALGEHLVSHFLSLWEDSDAGQQLIALLKASSGHAAARARIQQVFETQLLRAVAAFDCCEQTARTRAALIASQMLGLAMVRYVLMLPTGDIGRETLIRVLGKTIQAYLTGPL